MNAPEDLPCPCGHAARHAATYAACCGRLHAHFAASGELIAASAEALMRSRYSAFVRDELAYLQATWHASTRPTELSANEPGLKWLGLDVKKHGELDADHAWVEFVARCKLGGKAQRLQERSRFVRENGAWFYLDGKLG